MRAALIKSLRAHATGHIEKHKANLEIYLKYPAGIGEHPDVLEAMEKEISEIAKWDDQLEVLNKHFS